MTNGLKRIVPGPLRRLLGLEPRPRIRFSGSYPDWQAARDASHGYDSAELLEKVKRSLLMVKRGEAVYERDSVLFDRIEHAYPLLVGLMRCALANHGELELVDIGGSLGSSYFQCRGMLDRVARLRWNVVEQESFVACGRAHFQSEELRFYEDLQSCLAENDVELALLSSVLPYVESPASLVETVLKADLPFVVLDRTPMWSLEDRLTVQFVPAFVYGFDTSYPAWIFNRDRLLEPFLSRYRVVDEFVALSDVIDVDGDEAHDTGFLLERRD